MKRLIVILLLALALPLPGTLPAWSQSEMDGRQEQDALLPITQAMAAATARFAGQIVAAELQPGRPEDMTDIVYAFRLLTERGDMLALRVDAVSGQILEVDGRGLVDARRRTR